MSYVTDGVMVHLKCLPVWFRTMIDRDIHSMRTGNLKDTRQKCVECECLIGVKGFYFIQRRPNQLLGFNMVTFQVIGNPSPKQIPMHDASPNQIADEIEHCTDCGAEIGPNDYHACPGRPGENQW